MIQSVLIANRGAIAVRIIRSLKAMGIKSIAVYSEADASAPHVAMADEAWFLGEGRASETYLNQASLFEIIEKSGAQAVHPGYGFLSENADFCEAVEAKGIAFIGPRPAQMRAFGLKHEARALALQHQVPLLPGTGLLSSIDEAVGSAQSIGYPVMLKSTAGGGGIGMQICSDEGALRHHWESIKRLSENNFSNGGVFLEKYIEFARHIEVQVFGDGEGQVLVLGDRDCSSQRRHQKVLEEAPAPNIPDDIRKALHEVSKRLTEAVQYRNAGTVEFIYNQATDEFYFLEVNTRLQVEHGVTESVYQVDLVQWMVQCAAGTLPTLASIEANLSPKGHAIQARLYAENPAKNFQPSTGILTSVQWPEGEGLRFDHWVDTGSEITAFYDPMLGKVIAYQEDRDSAIKALQKALENIVLQGIVTNKEYCEAILRSDVFTNAQMTTRYLSAFEFAPNAFEVLQAGTMTTIQDYPGRIGYWHVGVPPSGPFDAYAFRLGNAILGNEESAAGLEITVNGPTLKFYQAQTLVLTGAQIVAQLDDEAITLNQPFTVEPNQVLTIGQVSGAGARSYLLFQGGLNVAPYLNSAATFTLGQFGGVCGRALKVGDFIGMASAQARPLPKCQIPIPSMSHHWQLHVMYGPHGAPDFFTEDDIAQFFEARWKIHYNSSRTGIRLIGPKPKWARSDGGEAGLHPSNIHDNAYAIGAVDFTGDMPVILGPDGPSLGGFVCPVTVISADHWKLGQLSPGDTVEFIPVSLEQAVEAWRLQSQGFSQKSTEPMQLNPVPLSNPIVRHSESQGAHCEVSYRLQGDQNLLVEFGLMALDIRTRFRAHGLMLWLQARQAREPKWQQAIIDITPGVRSVQVHFDPLECSMAELLALLTEAEQAQDNEDNLTVPSRIVHLPLSWDDQQCRLAVQKYMQSVRKEAPWCPDNIEFIRRINGLNSVEAVKDIVLNASYVVLGLGDVYLGAPVATPLDPRHRLVTTKYNPARTWTAENSVGIGGSYMCIYGMEGPGGYQFVGRTVQMWNRYRQTEAFTQPWLLRFFDQIRFYEVEAEELQTFRKQFPLGQYPIRIEDTTFSLLEYERFLQDNQTSIQSFVSQRNKAFQAELDSWRASGQFHYEDVEEVETALEEAGLPADCCAIESPVSGSVWQWLATAGQTVNAGDVVCVLESMKMEIEVTAPCAGVVQSLARGQGQSIQAGQTLAVVKTR